MRIAPLQLATLAIASVFVARAAVRMVQPEFNILRFAVLGWPPWTVWGGSAAGLGSGGLLIALAGLVMLRR